MSKNLFGKFFVFLLVVGLLFAVAPTGQALAQTPTGYEFVQREAGTAAISTEQFYSSNSSVKFTTGAVAGNSDAAMVRFTFPDGFTLDELTALNYWEYVDTRESDLDIFLDIWLDFDNDGFATTADYPGYMQAEPYYVYGAAALDTWTYVDGMTLKWSTYVGPDDPYNAPTIAQLQANTVPTWTNNVDFGQLDILRIDVRVGYGYPTWNNFIGYADDITINGYVETFPPMEVWVCPTGSCGHTGAEFATIQGGINAVGAGGTVNVAAGVYNENLTITKSLSLLGAGDNVVTVNGVAPTTDAGMLNIVASNVTIDGFKFVAEGYKTIRLNAPTTGVTFSNNTVIGATYDGDPAGGWILFESNYNNAQSNLTITDNVFENHGGQIGVYLNPQITGLTFTGNTFQGTATSGPVLGIDGMLGTEVITGNTFNIDSTYALFEGFGTVPIVNIFNANTWRAGYIASGKMVVPASVVYPSTNDINRDNGWAHVNFVGLDSIAGTAVFEFVQPRGWAACVEYRTNLETTPFYSIPNYNPEILDGMWRFRCLYAAGSSTISVPLGAAKYVEFRLSFGAEKDERFYWTPFMFVPEVWVDDDWAGTPAGTVVDGHTFGTDAFAIIQEGIDAVTAGGTVHVAAGAYSGHVGPNVDLSILKSLSLIGAGKASTTFTFSGDQHGLEIRPDAIGNVTIQGITFAGSVTGNGIIVGEASLGGHFENLTFRDIEVSYSGANNLLVSSQVTVNKLIIDDSSFHHAGSWGAWIQSAVSDLTVSDSSFTYNGTVDVTHGIGFDITGGVAKASVTNSQFNYNKSKGINITGLSNAVFDNIEASYNSGHAGQGHGFSLWEFTTGSNAILVKNSIFTGNAREGIMLGAQAELSVTGLTFASNQIINNLEGGVIIWDVSTGADAYVNLVFHHNRIVGNPSYDLGSNASNTINAENNWFGCNDGSCIGTWGYFDTNPWLVMNVSALPILAPDVTSVITADLRFNSAAANTSAAGFIPPTLVSFSPTAYMDPDTKLLALGLAASTFTPPVSGGTINVCATLDNETVCLAYTKAEPLNVYVDISWVGTLDGATVTPVYPAGAPAAVYGFNAFDNLHEALAAVAVGGTVYVDAGTYSGSGTVLINTNNVTVRMNDGVIVQNSSPCFTVAADYVTIKADSYRGAVCVPTADSDGIVVTGVRTNLSLEKFEILGTNGDDGVYFDNVITDLVIVDLYVYDLTSNGILFAAQPAGIIDIHGNMFRDNDGNGIEAGAFTVPAEYNSWGNLAGATAGDGASAGVDWTPWTHMDLLLESSNSPWVNQEVVGGTITYTVKANLWNVNSADFILYYPANLTYVSSTLGGTFGLSETLTQATGSLHFIGYSTTGNVQPTTNPVTLFTVTFTAASTVKNAAMNLDDTTDGFGMISVGSSSNVYAYELVDGEVTVIDLPTISSTDIQGPYVAGLIQEFHVRLENPLTGGTFTNVLVNFTIEDILLADVYSFEYFDGTTWWNLPLTQVGDDLVGSYGPSTGFPMSAPYDATSLFRIVVVTPGSYNVHLEVVDLTTDPDYVLDTFDAIAVVTGNFTITGTFSMQGRVFRGGLPVRLTDQTLPVYGPYNGVTIDRISNNLTITNVNGGTYLITTLQPRYLNLTAANNKTIAVDGNKTLNPLELKGGNASWRLYSDNKIDGGDASIVGTAYGIGDITSDGDCNFDGKVNIQDLALVGGNYDLTSEVAYGVGNVAPWIPLP